MTVPPTNDLRETVHEGFVILHVIGYCEAELGARLVERIESLARAGNTRIVIDLATCSIINSPGVASLLDAALRLVEDFRGRLVLCGLDRLKTSVLSMAKVLPMVPATADVPTAVALLQEHQR